MRDMKRIREEEGSSPDYIIIEETFTLIVSSSYMRSHLHVSDVFVISRYLT